MRSLEDIAREVVEALAPLPRRAGSPAEHEAADWLAERLRRTGARAEVEEVEFLDGYAAVLLPLGAVAVLCAGVARTRRGRLAERVSRRPGRPRRWPTTPPTARAGGDG